MRKCSSPILRIAFCLQACCIVFITLGMGLAQSAAAWNFAHQTLSKPSAGLILFGAIAFLGLAMLSLALWRIFFRRFGALPYLWFAVLTAMLIQLAVMAGSKQDWKWTNDAYIFRHYLERLSEEGYSANTLGELSQNYDYRVWTRRAQPFYIAIYRNFGKDFPLAIQFFQMFLVGIALVFTWRLARLMFGREVAFWATSLQWIMPFRWFALLDLNHHLLGGLYYLAGLWILVEWIRGPKTTGRRWFLSVCAIFLFPLLRLEGGVDLVYAASVALVAILDGFCGNLNRWKIAHTLLVLLGIPLAATAMLLSPLTQRIAHNDLHHHESGLPAFMARGWSPETGGEYAHTYEVIDYLTPIRHKKPIQLSILASQAFYNGHSILFHLLPIKMAKYFLLGYAAGAEEMLTANGAHRTKAYATGARAAFLLCTLPLMIWGSVLLLPLLRHPRRLALVLPCAAICSTYILLGETSPRYSIYIQPFLFILGALPLAWPRQRQIRLGLAARLPAVGASSLLAILLASAALSLHTARPLLQRAAFIDLRTWRLPEQGHAPLLSPTLAPLEIHLLPTRSNETTVWNEIDLPATPEYPGLLTFYIFSPDAPSSLARQTSIVAEYTAEDTMYEQTNSLPGRICLPYSAGTRGKLRLRTPGWFPYPLQIGYATYEPVEETIK